jgi:hypothetical protein
MLSMKEVTVAEEVTVADVNSHGQTLLHVGPVLLESINGSFKIRDLTLSDRSRLRTSIPIYASSYYSKVQMSPHATLAVPSEPRLGWPAAKFHIRRLP